MKTFSRRSFLVSLLLCHTFIAFSSTTYYTDYDCKVGRIYYNLDSETKTAKVTYSKWYKSSATGTYYKIGLGGYSGSITIPDSITYNSVTYAVTSIGNQAFHKSTSVTSVTIPEGVVSIGDSAFCNCTSLKTINIPSGVTSIGSRIFSGCSALEEIVLPNNLKTIGDRAFYDCSSLNSIDFPDSLTGIGYMSFAYCSSLDSIYIPAHVTTVGSWPFEGCTGLKKVVLDISLDKICKGNTLTKFSSCFGFNVEEVVLNDSTTYIPTYTFQNYTKLKSISLPNNLSYIGTRAFYNCKALCNIEIPENVQKIGNRAFYNCASLEAISIPEKVDSIPVGVFAYCENLKDVTLSENITVISDSAFYGCSSITNIEIPNSLTKVGNYAFEGCSQLTEIGDFSEGLKTIGDKAFYNCTSVTATHLTIPSTLTSIGDSAFYGWDSITDLTINTDLSIWVSSSGKSFYRSSFSNLRRVNLNESTTSIPSYAFYNCTSLQEINMSDGITSIGDYAFYNAGLTSVIISEKVKSVGTYAFYKCPLDTVLILTRSVDFSDTSVFSTSTTKTIFAYKSIQDQFSSSFKSALHGILPLNVEVDETYAAGAQVSITQEESPYLSSDLPVIITFNGETISSDSIGSFLISLPLVSSNKERTFELTCTDEEGVSYYDTDTFVQPSLGSLGSISSTSKTQTTITLTLELPSDDTFSTSEVTDVVPKYKQTSASYVAYSEYETTFSDGKAIVKISGLASYTSYDIYIYLMVDGSLYQVGSETVKTSSITWALKNYSYTPTTFSCKLNYNFGDAVLDTAYTTFKTGVVDLDLTNRTLDITGLKPSASYTPTLYAELADGKTYSCSYTFTTSDLELTTEQPKVLSSTSALISATTNINESETNVGFEWRKTDSPDEVASKSATAEIYDGELSGVIKNLSESTYYKYRAYYTSYTGTTYYGDWVGIDTDDYSYFEPTVKTGDVEVSDSYVTAKGYVLQGTEDIEDQGFEYWVSSSSAKVYRASSATPDEDVMRVSIDGQKMTATLTNLLGGTTYEIRAYATTASGTTYGETMQFTTAETTGISNITASGSEGLELLVRQSDGLAISVTGDEKDECNYRIFSITGGMVASGKVATDGNWYTVADANTLKGIFVIIATDGSETKTKKLLVK